MLFYFCGKRFVNLIIERIDLGVVGDESHRRCQGKGGSNA